MKRERRGSTRAVPGRARLKEEQENSSKKETRCKRYVTRSAKELREWAHRTGELPHMFLLRVSRGELIDDYKPTVHDRIDAAKFSAPYFAPKLGALQVTGEDGGPIRSTTLVIDPTRLAEFSEEELNVLERAVVRLQRGPDGTKSGQAAEDLERAYQTSLDL